MADKTPEKNLNIEEIAQDVSNALSTIEWQSWGTAALVLLCGFLIASFAGTFAGRILVKYTSAHYTQIIRRILYYGIIIVSFLFALGTLQLNMQVLGLATILTLAIGFASQTAMANIITGLFLVFERPFSVGDLLEYNGITGELLSIDLLSIKLLTFQNTQVRIPNEMLLKNQFINLTRFPTRRLDTMLQISADEDLERVSKILFELAQNNSMVLKSPEPKILFDSFIDGTMKFGFAVWLQTEDYNILKNQFACEIYTAFRTAGIKLPTLTVRLENKQTI